MMKINASRGLINFALWIISHVYTIQLKTRFVAVFLIAALLMPVFLFNPTGRSQAKINPPLQQRAPISAPPEPYSFSSNTSVINILPSLETITKPVSSGYRTVAEFIAGPETHEGLGAATPPPTYSERFTGFFASLFVSPGRKTLSKKSKTKENVSTESVLPTSLGGNCGAAFDFDGDCLADFIRWQPNSFQFKIYDRALDSYGEYNMGSSSSKIVPADYDGNGVFDIAVFSAGSWTYRLKLSGRDETVSWGTTGDLPYPADYDGDAVADFTVYRPSTNTFGFEQIFCFSPAFDFCKRK